MSAAVLHPSPVLSSSSDSKIPASRHCRNFQRDMNNKQHIVPQDTVPPLKLTEEENTISNNAKNESNTTSSCSSNDHNSDRTSLQTSLTNKSSCGIPVHDTQHAKNMHSDQLASDIDTTESLKNKPFENRDIDNDCIIQEEEVNHLLRVPQDSLLIHPTELSTCDEVETDNHRYSKNKSTEYANDQLFPQPASSFDATSNQTCNTCTSIIVYNPLTIPIFHNGTNEINNNMDGPSTITLLDRQKRESSSKGLVNLGNTCYLNSALQMLLSVDEFVNDIISSYQQHLQIISNDHDTNIHENRDETSSTQNQVHNNNPHDPNSTPIPKRIEYPLRNALAEFFLSMRSCNHDTNHTSNNNVEFNNTVDPSNLKSVVDQLTPQFVGFEQQDAHEFLSTLLDLLHDEIKIEEENIVQRENESGKDVNMASESIGNILDKDSTKFSSEMEVDACTNDECATKCDHDLDNNNSNHDISLNDEVDCLSKLKDHSIANTKSSLHNLEEGNEHDVLSNSYIFVERAQAIDCKEKNLKKPRFQTSPVMYSPTEKKLRKSESFSILQRSDSCSQLGDNKETHSSSSSTASNNRLSKSKSSPSLVAAVLSGLQFSAKLVGGRVGSNIVLPSFDAHSILVENDDDNYERQNRQHHSEHGTGNEDNTSSWETNMMMSRESFENDNSTATAVGPYYSFDDTNNDINKNETSNHSAVGSTCSNHSTSPAQQQNTPVDTFFKMVIRTRLTCDSCNFTRAHEEIYRHLSIEVGSSTKTSNTKNQGDEEDEDHSDPISIHQRTVQEGLRKFFAPEKRQLKCEKCFCETATQTMEISKLPKALIIHFKRFIVDFSPDFTSVTYRKNQAAVEFENSLSVDCKDDPNSVLGEFAATDVCLPSLCKVKRDIEEEGYHDCEFDDVISLSDDIDIDEYSNKYPKYKLRSVVNHIGNSASCGHYTADACRKLNDIKDNIKNRCDEECNIENEETLSARWMRFNDSFVSNIQAETVVGEASQKTAYMVMYVFE